MREIAVPRSVIINLRRLVAGGDPRDGEGTLGILDGILARDEEAAISESLQRESDFFREREDRA